MSEVISVIVPIYKKDVQLEYCINSILYQKYYRMQILLVVSEASETNHLDICEKIAERDNRVKVITSPESNPLLLKNIGIGQARGKYVAFIETSNRLEAHMFEEMVRAMRRENAKIAMCGYAVLEKRERRSGRKIPQNRVFESHILTALLYPKGLTSAEKEKYKKEKWKYWLPIVSRKESFCLLTNKLYKRELFKNLRFAEGKPVDYVMERLIKKSYRMVCLQMIGYRHIQN